MSLRIALIGTRGAPARYGGFETAVEEIGARLADRGHEIVVYCRNPDQHIEHYRGMRLVNLGVPALRGVQTLAHTAASVVHQGIDRSARADVAVVFNAANFAFVRPLVAMGIRVALHVDGLEWQRTKWGRVARRYYRLAEVRSARLRVPLIADSMAIATHYRDRYGVEPVFIAYGADTFAARPADRIAKLGLHTDAYHLVVARFEPENNIGVIIDGYRSSGARLPLVIVGDPDSGHPDVSGLVRRAAADPRVKVIGAIWDQDVLNDLYAHAASYVHGHSVGGTNPSLLRAMGAGAAVIAYDTAFNREVLGDDGRFFSSGQRVAVELRALESDAALRAKLGAANRERVRQHYDWDAVAEAYEELCLRILTRR